MENNMVYTIWETAQLLRVNRNTVYKLIHAGYLEAFRLGNLKVTRAELERFLNDMNGKEIKF